MIKKLLLFGLSLLTIQQQAQTTGRTCGTGTLPQQFETWVQTLTPSNPGKNGSANVQSVFNIPVIVHVIHNNESVNTVNATTGNNLNAAQIVDQINILNKDFNGTNTDTSLIPAVFKPFLGKFNVNFCLAVVNPTGGVLAEPGIDRINRIAKGWNSTPYSQTYIDATVKPNSIWNPNKYFNIWVAPLSNGLLGYATFPNPGTSGIAGLSAPYGSTTTDGVVVLNTAFGSIGTAGSGAYNKGRTATHEIGHWMGLRHIWGDGSCATDYCNDTPSAQNANFGCPNFPYKLGTCSGNTTGEMTMNYMDYTNDACMYMFSKDQKVRAQLILTNSSLRASLITSTVCNLPSIGADAGISYISSPTYSQTLNCPAVLSPVINLTNYGAVTLTTAVIAYNVNGANTQTFNWTGNLAPNSSTAVALPQLTVATMGQHNYSVNVSSPNGGSDANLINNNSTQSFSVSGNFLTVSAGTTCPGVPVIITASGASSYTWNTGANTATIAPGPLSSSVYTVSGKNGACIDSKTINVVVVPLPNVTVNKQSVCYNTTSNISASGASTYSWSTGSAVASTSINITTATVFTVTGFSSPLCFTNKIFTVTVNPLPTSTITHNNLSCSSCNDGTITVVASGGTGPYTYNWVPGNINTPEITDVAGCYTVTITDALGCSSVDTACVSFDVGMKTITSELKFVSISPNPSGSKFSVFCADANTMNLIVTDALGRLVKTLTVPSNSAVIDLGSEAKGVYYLKINSNNKTKVVKLLKE
ncbi:MAG: T9SS type A sorting domain-containing protein [Bacteroidia bacterium]|nr:T9SS type A sorting domain-containing protein [Bacteroidia bacterium]